MPARHTDTYGARAPDLSGPFPRPTGDVSLNSPVGTVQDEHGNVWVADTGNNRLLVYDRDLSRVLGQIGTVGPDAGEFELPFRLAHHPTAQVLFVTDIGNGRVQQLSYAYDDGPTATVDGTLAPDGPFHPNGVAVRDGPAGLRIVVADEFYHESPTEFRSRLVVFDGDGDVVRTIRAVERPGAPDVPLYWPQGLDVGPDGNVLVANTGYGVQHRVDGDPPYFATVVRCDLDGRAVPFPHTGSPVLDDEFLVPRGVSYLPEEERIVVPDVGGGHVYAYAPDGDSRGEVPSRVAPDLPERRFGAPMAVASYDPGEAEPTGPIRARAVVTEALANAVGAYRLRLVAERRERLGRVASDRDDRGQFDYAGGAVLTGRDDGRRLWVADAGNGRLQRTGPGLAEPLSTAPLSANRFPAALATWAPGGDRYLLAADYDPDAGERDDERQLHVYRVDDGLDHVAGFGEWGYFGADVKLPRGMAIEPLDADRARVHVADSLNGRVGQWVLDRTDWGVESDGYAGGFGHDPGEFWLPADVAVGDGTLFVADRNNSRLQYDAGDGWTTLGRRGYGDDSHFLLPTSLALAGGYLFVVDLVNRAVKVFEVTDGVPSAEPVDAFGTFGGGTKGGDLWFPTLVSAAAHDDGVTVCLPDSVLNVVYRFEWTPP